MLRRGRAFLLSLLLAFATSVSQAEYRLGGYLGFGGTGIKSVNTVSGVDVNVERSEGPGVVTLAVEYLLKDKMSLSIDHMRGVFLSPFSSGVGLTGVTWRWFFGGAAPSVVESEESTLIVGRRVPFLGIGTGIASGSIVRENDLVPSITAGGIYMGFHGGYDHQTAPGRFTRVEVVYAMTPESSGFVKSSLSAFALQVGMFFIY